MMERLNGMVAFAIWDCATGDVFLARDRLGIEPLYWARPPGSGAVRFASEMHAFDPDWQPYVEPFPPGCAWTPKGGLVRFATAISRAENPVFGATGSPYFRYSASALLPQSPDYWQPHPAQRRLPG